METEPLKHLDPRLLGERLKEARKARAMTQEAVAERLGILRTTLVAIEKGDRRVTSGELIEMAQLYGRSVSEFVSQRANKTPFVPQFRLAPNQKNLTEAEMVRAAMDLESLARDFVELEEMHGSPARPQLPPIYAIEVPGATPEQRGEDAASDERTRLGLGDGPIADLRSLLEEAASVRIFYIGLPARIAGLYACNDELGPCIAINRNHPPTRANWSLAHEYGHFISTRYQADVGFAHEGHWGKISAEKFADSFAKHFLMPRAGVGRRLSEAVQGHGKGVTVADVMALAHFYRVSAEAMFLRLEELKRLPNGTWDKLRNEHRFQPEKARAALGLARESQQPMLPLRYRLLALSAFDQKELLTEGQLARKLRVDRVSARMELESLRKMADQSDNDGYTAVELDPGQELIPA